MTVTAIDAYQPPAALAIRPGQEMWTDKQRAALSVLGIRDASNADLAVFMHVSQRTGLDPFSKQIYMIKRRVKEDGQWIDKWTIQTGIDGFRVIRDRVAERQGVTVEYEDTIWYDRDGGEHKVWLRDDDEPAAPRVQGFVGPVAPAAPVAQGPAAGTVPNFKGMTLRAVLMEAAAKGISVQPDGSGVARVQNPPAGAVWHQGERIRVQFAR